MACPVTTQDVQKSIKDKLIDKLETARPINGGSAVFAAYNISNKDKLANQVKVAMDDINAEFHSEVYGNNFDKVIKNEHGITIPIKENEILADAMYAQNIQDEVGTDYYMGDEALREQEEQYSFSPRLQQNAKRPLTDNFTEYKNHKLAQLNRVEGLLKSYKLDKKNPKKDLTKTIENINKLTVMKSGLENDIEALDKKDVALMFHAISKEIDDLSKTLDASNNNNIVDFKERLGFLFKFVKGTAIDDRRDLGIEHLKGFDHPDFEKISLALDTLNLKYRAELERLRNEIVDSDISYINNVINNDEITPEQMAAMFEAKSDINSAEALFLGITESSTNDTILPQVLKSMLETKATVREAEAKTYQDKLNTLVQKIGNNFDFIFEKDAQGNKTGNIVSMFSPLYRGKLYQYSSIHHNDELDAEQKYKQKVNWLSENAEVIDHTKLNIIKHIYGDRYDQYFTATQEEMDDYERELRDKLGPLYDSEIDKVMNALENYQESKEALMDSSDPYKYKNTARIDPWHFIKHFNSSVRNELLTYYTPAGTADFVYPDIANTRFIPKKEVIYDWATEHNEETDDFEEIPLKRSSGYFNESFNEIQSDPNKLEYWNLMSEIYGDYVNPTYGTNTGLKNLSYAKFEESWIESIASTQGVGKVGKLLGNSMKGFKSYFYEVGSHKEDTNEVRKSYRDMSRTEISKLSQVLQLKTLTQLNDIAAKEGMNPGDYKTKEALAKAIATNKVLSNYSDDINKVTSAILSMTALQKAKEDTLPIANLLLDAHSVASDGKRKRSIDRMQNYINRVIKNQNDKSRGTESILGQPLSKESFLDIILDKTGSIPWLRDYLNKKSTALLTDNEKEILKHLQDIKASTITDDTLKAVNANIEALGLHTSAAGIAQGIMKMIMLKSMALNPVSGIFNRIEGMNSGLIMDASGKYWTKGNLKEANQFMLGSNFIKFMGRLNPAQTKKVKELEKFQMLLNGMSLIQDRKSELERSTGTGIGGIIEEKFNPYQFAVDNPEMKNQGAIVLSVLKDTMITGPNGSVPIFDGTGFPAHEVKDGNLVLKPEFATPENLINWEHFNIDEQNVSNNSYFLTRSKIKNAISRSQGNYDNLDVIEATKSLVGKIGTMFLKWMPEHAMQRFASGEGFDLTTGQQKLKGRYRSLYENPHILLPVLGASLAAGFGAPAVLVGGITLGVGTAVARKYFSKDALTREANGLLEMAQFAETVIFNTLNYPAEFVNANVTLKNVKYTSTLPLDARTNLSQEDINNLQAVAKELAIKLTFVALLWAGKMLLTDPDDDEEEQKINNFFDNQASRMIASLDMWSDPTALYTTLQRNAFFEYVKKLQKVSASIINGNEEGDLEKNIMKALPLPGVITKMDVPWKEDFEFDKKQWQDKYVKTHGEGGEEYIATKEYEGLRKEAKEAFTEQYRSLGLEGDVLEDAVKKAMRKKFPRKKPKETNVSIMKRIKSGQVGHVSKKRKKKSN